MDSRVRSWDFLKDGAGILPASNMADPLRGSNLTPTDLLVRESVQNSLDERRLDDETPLLIRFERRVMCGHSKEQFINALDLDVLADRRKEFRTAHYWFARGNSILDNLGNPDVPLPVLMVSDFNANGLGGHWNRRRSRQDRFFNLVLSIGGSLKWEDEEGDGIDAVRTLGSYGYGKMAFALSSDIRTVVYYSTFIPGDAARAVRCRAMATAFLPQHSVNDIDYAGQAYYGNDSGEERNPREPLENDDAHRWIETLGLPRRSEDKTGTTVIIPASSATMEEIVEACERWWWPTMGRFQQGRQVEFEFVDDGAVIPGGKPRSRVELSPFIDCYKLLKSNTAGDKYDLRDVRVNPANGQRNAGRLVLKSVDVPAGSEESATFTNCIAFVRDGIVIKYATEFAHEDKPPVVGVFSPDPEPDTLQAFVFSEPPTHDDWVENGDRLRGKYDWGRQFIRLTKQRLRNLTRDFQTRQMDAPAVERTNAADFLRKTLRNLFTRPGPSPPPVPKSRLRAFTIETTQSGRTQNGNAQEDFAVFRLGLSTHAPLETVEVDVSLSLKVLADDNIKPMDALAPWVTTSTGDHGERSHDGRTTFRTMLHRRERLEVKARAIVHPAWATRWDIEVARKEERPL